MHCVQDQDSFIRGLSAPRYNTLAEDEPTPESLLGPPQLAVRNAEQHLEKEVRTLEDTVVRRRGKEREFAPYVAKDPGR